ncbi:MAG: flavodoxin family protein [Sutterellaceae bacterium]|nr:flavodoxin family protein [Sutterellaceae bacterium]
MIETKNDKSRTLVVASSLTGNTLIVAHGLADAYSAYPVARPTDDVKIDDFDTILLGFWCDKGDAPLEIYEFAQKIKGKRIGCFATMGGNAQDPKALAWMKKTSEAVVAKGEGNTLTGDFICRGRIDPALFERMTAMMGGTVTPEREARRKESETHPDRMDVLAAVEFFADKL